MSVTVQRITIFPIKSCDGVEHVSSVVLPSGALAHDRQFALVDSEGRFINAKRTPLIHRLQLQIDPVLRQFQVARRDGTDRLVGQLDQEGASLSDWLSQFFSLEVSIVENGMTGFPDDLDAGGPTIVSTATLETVAGWFEGLNVDEVRRRFRANIEIGGVEPFWEDRLFREDHSPQSFQIGDVVFGGINPCQRCVVPTRDSLHGDLIPAAFSKHFAMKREESLPDWAPRKHFNHFYRLSTNTILLNRGTGIIRQNDQVVLIS